MSRDLARSSNRGVMEFYEWKPFKVCDKRVKFGDHRHCGSGEIMVLVCEVTLCDLLFKALCDLMGGHPSY